VTRFIVAVRVGKRAASIRMGTRWTCRGTLSRKPLGLGNGSRRLRKGWRER